MPDPDTLRIELEIEKTRTAREVEVAAARLQATRARWHNAVQALWAVLLTASCAGVLGLLLAPCAWSQDHDYQPIREVIPLTVSDMAALQEVLDRAYPKGSQDGYGVGRLQETAGKLAQTRVTKVVCANCGQVSQEPQPEAEHQ